MKKKGHYGYPKLKKSATELFLKCNILEIKIFEIKFKNLKLNSVLSPS